MKIFFCIVIGAFGFSIESKCQIFINNKIVIANDSATIRNLADPSQPNDPLPARFYQNGTLLSATSKNTNGVLEITPFFQMDSLISGIIFRVYLSDSIPSDSATIYNRGYTIKRTDEKRINKADFPAGRIIWVSIINNNIFISSGIGQNGCPLGFVAANNNYCIQINEIPVIGYWTLNLYCESLGGKLCTWGEWYYACQKTSLGMINTTNNWEWIDGAQNHSNAGTLLGNGACDKNFSINVFGGTTAAGRCCYTK
ncbi:MAG TPA: hypothetical protein PK559_11270 [Ignavibacteriaceae bacterium]|nr:hypothetical protein [Flavobacterium sp.]HRI47675.1 hypothetical protein [Ignavibacteriaceae bacterium]